MKAKTLAVVMLTLLAGSAGLGQEHVASASPFSIEVDYAKFFGSDSEVYVEVYYGIREQTLTLRNDSTGFNGKAALTITVHSRDSIIAGESWFVPHRITDTSKLGMGQTLVGKYALFLKPGEYLLAVAGHDAFMPDRRDSISLTMKIEQFPSDRISISEVQLSTLIESSNQTESMFYKNTLNVIPNPSMLYGSGLPFLYYYAEAYNLSVGDTSEARLIVAIVDPLGNELYRQVKPKSRKYNSIVEYGKINVSGFKSGTYELHLTFTDTEGKGVDTASKKFFVYKPGAYLQVADSSVSDNSSNEFLVMTEEELDKEFTYAKYIASDAEREQYPKLTDTKAKRTFLARFWSQRAAGELTRDEYRRRMDHVDRTYARGFRAGWKTDRGRIYLTYGAPDEIERFSSSSESNPYEIWHFNNLQGGVVFVFVDRNGLGEFSLVHSSHRNELHDENWFQEYAQKLR